MSGDPTEAIETVDSAPEVGTSGAPVLVSKVNLQNIFRHPDAHPIALDLLLLQKFGPEWMGWEPEAIELRIMADFKTPTVSEVNLAKILSVSTLHLVDTYWQRWEVFNWMTAAFNGVPPDFDILQVPTVAQVLVSVDVANRIRNDLEWSPEVKAFVISVYKHDGILMPLPPADFVSLEAEDYPVDLMKVLQKWPEVRAFEKAPTEESPEAEQLRRLLLVHQYLEESRAHLRQQLFLVRNA